MNRYIVSATVFVAAAVSAVGSDHTALTVACGAVFALTIALLWRPGEPPVLLLPAGIQLTQVVTPTFYANALGVPIQNVSLHLGDTAQSTWLALLGMLCLVVGMWCGQLGLNASVASSLHQEVRIWSPRAAFKFCGVTIIIAAVCEVLAGAFGGLTQLALAASGIQWVGIFVLACVCVAQQRGYGYLLIVTCLEVVQGFIGYFSSFRTVFYVLLIGIVSARSKLRPQTMLVGLAVGVTLLFLGVWWSSMKMEYRSFLNQGSKQQVVLVPIEDRIAFLVRKLSEIDGQTIGDGFDRLAQRVGYVDYLAAVMRHVPSRLPYQDGAQIGEALAHVLQPRLFFPDKPPVPDDSAILEKYAGFRFGDSSGPGTSVSMGYVAELYVDFGPLGVAVGMFILGALVGRAIRYVVSSGALPATVNCGLAIMLAMTFTQFDEALIKFVGSFLTTLVMILLLRRFLLGQLLTMVGLSDQRSYLAHAADESASPMSP
jgi:flagellar biosynthesis protein FliQ